MSPSPARPVARLSPGELAAALPDLCGFVPAESLVVVGLRAPRMRTGLTLRVDLPDARRRLSPDEAGQLVELIRRDGADALVAAVVTEEADTPSGEHPRARAMRTLVSAARARGLEVVDVLLVRDGRWWSYECADPTCCSEAGTPVPTSSAALGAVAAARVASGRAVLGSRAELAATIAPSHPLGLDHARAVLEQAAAQVLQPGAPPWRARDAAAVHAEWLAALDSMADPRHQLADATVARLIVALHDIRVRDAVLLQVLHRPSVLLAALERCCRGALPGHQAPVCTALAWAQYVEGGGALCRIALDLALADDPGYSAAVMLQEALEAAAPPRLLRRSLREARPLTMLALRRDAEAS